MKMEYFTVIGDDGKKRAYEIILTFHNEQNGKDYVLYTDADPNKSEENGRKIYAGIGNPHESHSLPGMIGTDEEWEMVEEIIQTLREAAERDDLTDSELREHLETLLEERYGF